VKDRGRDSGKERGQHINAQKKDTSAGSKIRICQDKKGKEEDEHAGKKKKSGSSTGQAKK